MLNIFKRKEPVEQAPEMITVEEHERILAEAKEALKWAEEGCRINMEEWQRCEIEIGGLKERLREIAAQATPGANATVKRMAAIARGENVGRKRETV
jgi:hypothetical protein